MLTSFIRTVVLMLVIIISVRIMGKRQIGQLQPSELVVTILLSEMAATPMQDNDIPILNTLVAIAVLIGIEIILSAVSMKSLKLRSVLQGNSLILIRDGVLDQKQMKRMRYTIDDVLEALRQKDVFDISDVQYAIAETDGSISVLLKPERQAASALDVNNVPVDRGFPSVVIMDGRILHNDFSECGMTDKKLRKIVTASGLEAEEIFLMTVNKAGEINIIKKEQAK